MLAIKFAQISNTIYVQSLKEWGWSDWVSLLIAVFAFAGLFIASVQTYFLKKGNEKMLRMMLLQINQESKRRLYADTLGKFRRANANWIRQLSMEGEHVKIISTSRTFEDKSELELISSDKVEKLINNWRLDFKQAQLEVQKQMRALQGGQDNKLISRDEFTNQFAKIRANAKKINSKLIEGTNNLKKEMIKDLEGLEPSRKTWRQRISKRV